MKVFSLLAGSVFISTFVAAQVTKPEYKNLLKPGQPIDLTTTMVQPKAKLIGQSSLGAVYAMPLDNMPCLVPNMGKENFVFPLPGADMPNPIPKQDLIPSPFAKSSLLKLKKAPKSVSQNLMLDLIRKK